MVRAALAVLLVLLGAQPASARTVIADLSHHLIAIDTAFAGTDVVLFGTIEGDGDVAVVVRGPDRVQRVQEKERVAGIWVNSSRLDLEAVPVYYAVAGSRPLEEIASPSVRARLGLGLDVLRFEPQSRRRAATLNLDAFHQGLIRNKQRQGLYSRETGEVRFLGNHLFRTTISFPANVPPGTYRVEAYQLRDGNVIGAQSSVLTISKVGFEAAMADFASNHPPIYGLVALGFALMSGWLAGVMFRRD
ncbi:TIGR02186 family protein [Marinivivus vitaminiproducens]|uniref:TIGR02186 family protein n=1 Tax=Marinivivus vitaminiproducens TaxID=3035935 RepID=UPI0027A80047|nr:TIGR02186 family protein [Geminicoccaceae bacterium SCSIO 64248]